MRQMKSDFGFLIGADLRIYYDGQSNPHPDPILLEKIEFGKEPSEGFKFIELFNKKAFLSKEYQEYLEAKIKRVNIKREVKTTVDKILSLETKQKIERFRRYPRASPWHFKISQASLDLHPGVLAIGRI